MTQTKKFGFSLASILTLISGFIYIAAWVNKAQSEAGFYDKMGIVYLIFYGMPVVMFISFLLSVVALIRREDKRWSIGSLVFCFFPLTFLFPPLSYLWET